MINSFLVNFILGLYCFKYGVVDTKRIIDFDKLSQFKLLPQLPQIMMLASKVVKIDSKIIISIY